MLKISKPGTKYGKKKKRDDEYTWRIAKNIVDDIAWSSGKYKITDVDTTEESRIMLEDTHIN